jgi:hypothetical protein
LRRCFTRGRQEAQFLKPTVITLVYGLGFGMVLVLLVVPAILAMQQDFGQQVRALRRGSDLSGRSDNARPMSLSRAVGQQRPLRSSVTGMQTSRQTPISRRPSSVSACHLRSPRIPPGGSRHPDSR